MSNTVPVSLSQTQIATLEKSYTLKQRLEILRFLEGSPEIVSTLLEAPVSIQHYFPTEKLFLDIRVDPEVANYQEIVLVILTSLDPQEALKRQRHLDQDWWRGISGQVWDHLCVLLEYSDVV
ncbi:MAG: hypothetical protein H7126_05170 [Candidatus Parcubacteria bacterium]|nr:hypothetical protein [Leptolyngbyaceae cyanobacterium LF-bin-113]